MKSFLRWILVLPGAIVACHFVYAFTIGSTIFIPIPYVAYITEFIAGLLGAAAFVATGIYIAPNRKKWAGIGLVVLFFVYSVYAVIDPYRLYTDYGLFESIVYKVGGVMGSIAGFLFAEKEDE